MHLLIGPSNVGKSTWIAQNKPNHVCYAFQFSGDQVPSSASVLHYNLLYSAPNRINAGKPIEEWDLLEDPLLRRCLEGNKIAQATVIIAPIDELLKRAAQRKIMEHDLPEKRAYQSEFWLSVLNTVDHLALYRQIIDIFKHHSIPHHLLFNSEARVEGMFEVSESDLKKALQGDSARLISKA